MILLRWKDDEAEWGHGSILGRSGHWRINIEASPAHVGFIGRDTIEF